MRACDSPMSSNTTSVCSQRLLSMLTDMLLNVVVVMGGYSLTRAAVKRKILLQTAFVPCYRVAVCPARALVGAIRRAGTAEWER